MDPVSMFLMAVQAGGKIAQGFMASSLDKMQSDIQMGNSRLYSTQADTAMLDQGLSLTKGAYQQGQIAQKVTATEGAETGGFAARNIDPRYGSPLVMQMITAQQGENDKALVGAQARLEASNAVARAASLHNKSASAAWEAYGSEKKSVSDLIAGFTGAGSAIMAGGGKGGFSFGGDPSGGGGGKGGVDGSFDMMAG